MSMCVKPDGSDAINTEILEQSSLDLTVVNRLLSILTRKKQLLQQVISPFDSHRVSVVKTRVNITDGEIMVEIWRMLYALDTNGEVCMWHYTTFLEKRNKLCSSHNSVNLYCGLTTLVTGQ